ncbi:hypothetical protein P8935_23210 [Telmatobacter sp. DSM 110680]|uniref:Urocanase Rossmann-like domain-containing protein n=1 Tax=Telmatobacter sp. DSM 110680 TaxID=3036704 RepID=A0AAU7DL11_9BACT
MSSDFASASTNSVPLEAYNFYRALTRTALNPQAERSETEPNFGGSLLYVGELDAHGSAMVIAGNVSGCATLAATADLAAQKQAIRDGTVDFVVTSLDEALRILKNEIRKRATVAVCVGLAPSAVEREMLERGVLPDLVFAGLPNEHRVLPKFGFDAHEIQLPEQDSNQACLEWRVAQGAGRWMANLDAIALECLRLDSYVHRWIRLAPRYCGRGAQGQRALCCEPELAARIVEGFEAAIRGRVIGTEVSGSLSIGGETKMFWLSPAGAA